MDEQPEGNPPDALTAAAKVADDLQQQYRYGAACSATLAAAGQGIDAEKLDDKERARLRKQGVEWLRADLGLWAKQAGSDKRSDRDLVQKTLKHWQDDTDLTGIRDPWRWRNCRRRSARRARNSGPTWR